MKKNFQKKERENNREKSSSKNWEKLLSDISIFINKIKWMR